MKLLRPDLWIKACRKMRAAYIKNAAYGIMCPFCDVHRKIHGLLACYDNRDCVWYYFKGHACEDDNSRKKRLGKDIKFRIQRIFELTIWIWKLGKMVRKEKRNASKKARAEAKGKSKTKEKANA